MNYRITSFTSDQIDQHEYTQLKEFLTIECTDSTEPAAVNMLYSQPSGLMYNIDKQLRWREDQGRIYLMYDNDRVIGVSCVEFPERSQNFAIGGIRTWITQSHRSQALIHLLLDQHRDWAYQRSCKFLLLTFNHYNRAAHLAMFKSSKFRQSIGWSDWWDDCHPVGKPISIRNTDQWCIIKPVHSNDITANLFVLSQWEQTNEVSK